MDKIKVNNFTVIIEEDEDGMFVAEVPNLKGCYTQGETLTEVLENIKEVIELCG
ncbi:MAG: type II toxin-antitoxin system HicB family antitoxin [Candidatus Micrarchaeota archaeon]